MKAYVKEKVRILNQMGIMHRLSKLEKTKLVRSRNETECDNVAHSLIMKYL